ncbi:alanyl-tRNA editing protein [Haloplanus litoreus]|uniref:alanyl-tRNA editing protein n=1 Tax=Haloplanus litoreus TaxID=767515 RepID=UPI0036168731
MGRASDSRPCRRAPSDPDVREFEATVRGVDGRDVVLDRTYFYAESGGQPADRGTLAGVPLADVQADGDAVVHTLVEETALAPGDEVVGVVDDDFRTYCTRAHTASHLLYGAGRRLLDDLGYGGFGIDSEKIRVDFATSTDIDDAVLVELERLTNRAVWDSRPVSWERVPVDEARTRDDVAFNTKTEEGVMADADTVRLVDIEGWDVAACGGTHVDNTREIGPIEVLDRSNPGEGLTRVEFAVGPTAIDRRARIRGAALDAARELGTGVADLDTAVSDLLADRDALESEVREYKSEVLGARLSALPTVDHDGTVWRVGAVSDFGPNEVGEAAQDRVGDEADVIAAVGDSASPYVVVATTGEVDAGDVVEEVTAAFGGGGGGGPTFAQSGDSTPILRSSSSRCGSETDRCDRGRPSPPCGRRRPGSTYNSPDESAASEQEPDGEHREHRRSGRKARTPAPVSVGVSVGVSVAVAVGSAVGVGVAPSASMASTVTAFDVTPLATPGACVHRGPLSALRVRHRRRWCRHGPRRA